MIISTLLKHHATLNEVSPLCSRHRFVKFTLGAEADGLALSDCKACKGGAKFDLAIMFVHVLDRSPVKDNLFHKFIKVIWMLWAGLNYFLSGFLSKVHFPYSCHYQTWLSL